MISIQFTINWHNFRKLTNDILCKKIQITKLKSRLIKCTCFYYQCLYKSSTTIVAYATQSWCLANGYAFWYGWQEAVYKNWILSMALTNKSVDSAPFLRVTSTFKKLTFSSNQSAVDLIVGWVELISLLPSFSDSSPCL